MVHRVKPLELQFQYTTCASLLGYRNSTVFQNQRLGIYTLRIVYNSNTYPNVGPPSVQYYYKTILRSMSFLAYLYINLIRIMTIPLIGHEMKHVVILLINNKMYITLVGLALQAPTPTNSHLLSANLDGTVVPSPPHVYRIT